MMDAFGLEFGERAVVDEDPQNPLVAAFRDFAEENGLPNAILVAFNPSEGKIGVNTHGWNPTMLSTMDALAGRILALIDDGVLLPPPCPDGRPAPPLPRPGIQAFSQVMEERMRRHDGTRGDSWRAFARNDVGRICDLAADAFARLDARADAAVVDPTGHRCAAMTETAAQAADVANVLMMLAYAAGGFTLSDEGGEE